MKILLKFEGHISILEHPVYEIFSSKNARLIVIYQTSAESGTFQHETAVALLRFASRQAVKERERRFPHVLFHKKNGNTLQLVMIAM